MLLEKAHGLSFSTRTETIQTVKNLELGAKVSLATNSKSIGSCACSFGDLEPMPLFSGLSSHTTPPSLTWGDCTQECHGAGKLCNRLH